MLNQVDEDDELLAEEGRPKPAPGLLGGLCACFSVEYYRPYFDVDTEDVLLRLKSALSLSSTFLDVVKENPDAYGPWWISTTLIFLMAVTSHMAGLMVHGRDYEFDFQVVSIAACTVYTYVAILGAAIFLGLNYWLKTPLTLLQCFCVVGYSLTIYLPAALLCVFSILRNWPPLLAAWIFSSLFIVKSLFPIISDHHNQHIALFATAISAISAVFVFLIHFTVY